MRLRIHGPDGTAPPGSNSASGETYWVQRGSRYQDAAGNLYHKNVHKPESPYYDPDAGNAHAYSLASSVPGIVMTIGREHLGRLMSHLVSDSADVREAVAETVSDWADSLSTYSDFEARMLVRTLALVAASEDSTGAREAELNALTGLFSPKSMSAVDVAPVLNLSTADLGPSELEHIKVLRELSDVP